MYNDSEEALAGVVVEAVRHYAEAWFPTNGPPIPTVELCVRLNNELPFTHAVISRGRESWLRLLLWGNIQHGRLQAHLPQSSDSVHRRGTDHELYIAVTS
jgi:hypothetical protein